MTLAAFWGRSCSPAIASLVTDDQVPQTSAIRCVQLLLLSLLLLLSIPPKAGAVVWSTSLAFWYILIFYVAFALPSSHHLGSIHWYSSPP